MNLQNIVSEIEKVDPEVYDKLNTRRSAMKNFANLGGKLALAAVPLALGGMFKKAYGQTPADVLDVLQFALKLEYLEAAYYKQVVETPGLVPSGLPAAAYAKISQDETAHVAFLKGAITGAGATPNASPIFDFTAGAGSNAGPLSGANSPFTNYVVTLAVAQAFEDTGVRAYKGQAPRLINDNATLTYALRIHSVEARHAAHIRNMRRAYAAANGGNASAAIPAGVDVKPWITLNQSGIAAPFDALVQATYNGEESTMQLGVDITKVGGMTYSGASASESFDEFLTKDQVVAIITPFLKP